MYVPMGFADALGTAAFGHSHGHGHAQVTVHGHGHGHGHGKCIKAQDQCLVLLQSAVLCTGSCLAPSMGSKKSLLLFIFITFHTHGHEDVTVSPSHGHCHEWAPSTSSVSV
jgi:hypothetical protein